MCFLHFYYLKSNVNLRKNDDSTNKIKKIILTTYFLYDTYELKLYYSKDDLLEV